jgi:hypothetical protein
MAKNYYAILGVLPTATPEDIRGPYQCFRYMGNGSVSGDVPVTGKFPPGISDGYQRAISLRHLGIRDVYVSVLFGIGRTADVEVL